LVAEEAVDFVAVELDAGLLVLGAVEDGVCAAAEDCCDAAPPAMTKPVAKIAALKPRAENRRFTDSFRIDVPSDDSNTTILPSLHRMRKVLIGTVNPNL
jgi:hypothetical protein